MITLDEMIEALFPRADGKSPTPEQLSILKHASGPAWVLAGPGSGKTEVLALLALRLLYVGKEAFQPSPVAPSSILITTFTEKAAKNLEDRIGRYRSTLVAMRPELGAVDASELKIGTLHGLCNDLLQEHRAAAYQNVRLMDEFEQAMFVYEHLSAVKQENLVNDLPFWGAFEFLFRPNEWKAAYTNLPNKWLRTAALVKLFNRIAEDRVSVTAMRAAGQHWARLADLYGEYCRHLTENHRCDFSQLQVIFLQFLATPVGKSFLHGTPGAREGIKWVLVDEYQDTNLVQEAIYFQIAQEHGHNLLVVGDDDQAMYRFRGGSVECMVTFDQACQVYFGIPGSAVSKYPLAGNFRSHKGIVDFFNEYIVAFPSMTQPGSRVSGKQAMSARSTITGTYPSVGMLEGRTLADSAVLFAQAVRGLVDNGIVHDPSHCCLLLTSTKETAHNAAPYVAALRQVGLEPYNPRNKAFLEQEEVQGLLGALQAIIDPASQHLPNSTDLNQFIVDCRATFDSLAASNTQVGQYVAACVKDLSRHPGEYVDTNLQEIAYLLLSCAPFDGWHADPVRRIRLARLTALLESFTSMPVLGYQNVQRGRMKVDDQPPHAILPGWVRSFYYLFFGYLARSGMDEVSDDDVICPPGYVPIMTIHQAKGLEFPFVFVGHLSKTPSVGDAHRLEAQFSAFPGNSARSFPRAPDAVRAELDLIRQFYVAYSRAQYSLVLVGTKSQAANRNNNSVPCGPRAGWLTQRVSNL